MNVNDSVWKHAVWTLDTTGYWQVYLNGALRTYATGKFYPNSVSRAQNYIGKNNVVFTVMIDEFYMFKYVLSEAHILQLYSE
eukprot:gene4127-5201_t